MTVATTSQRTERRYVYIQRATLAAQRMEEFLWRFADASAEGANYWFERYETARSQRRRHLLNARRIRLAVQS